jgi:hypothetical protein
MVDQLIKSLFVNDIHRRIEEVIKVDQTNDDILRDEINEYVVTDAIRSHYATIFDAFLNAGCRTASIPIDPLACALYDADIEKRPIACLARGHRSLGRNCADLGGCGSGPRSNLCA